MTIKTQIEVMREIAALLKGKPYFYIVRPSLFILYRENVGTHASLVARYGSPNALLAGCKKIFQQPKKDKNVDIR